MTAPASGTSEPVEGNTCTTRDLRFISRRHAPEFSDEDAIAALIVEGSGGDEAVLL